MAACFAGSVYFVVIFTLAFAMGVARALIIAPHLGETLAVVIEVPVIVAASWLAARSMLRENRFRMAQCAVMGAVAFGLTMGSEAMLAGILRGQSIAEWAISLSAPTGLIGLAGQLAFAVMPMFHAKLTAQRDRS